MAADVFEVWCGGAVAERTPELAAQEPCGSLGSIDLRDPNGGWSGSYCEACAAVLTAAGWHTEATP